MTKGAVVLTSRGVASGGVQVGGGRWVWGYYLMYIFDIKQIYF